jgi:predicted RNA-binding protein YlqC (UPF0109 family)
MGGPVAALLVGELARLAGRRGRASTALRASLPAVGRAAGAEEADLEAALVDALSSGTAT